MIHAQSWIVRLREEPAANCSDVLSNIYGFTATCRRHGRSEPFNECLGLLALVQDHAGLAQPTSLI